MARDKVFWMVLGSVVAAFFGRMWFSSTGVAFPGRVAGVVDLIGWLVLAAMVVWGVVVWRAAPRLPHAPDAGRGSASPTWAWCAVVVVEVALIVGGQRVLTRVIHHAEWAPVWTLFVVGVHFVPFARIFGARTFNRLALALCALAAGTLVVAGMFGISSAWYTVPGFGGALILWAAALSGLASAWFGPRRVDPVGSP